MYGWYCLKKILKERWKKIFVIVIDEEPDLPAISRNAPGTYKRHPRSVASVSQQMRSTGKIMCPAMTNLRKRPVALGVIHVSWKPVKV